MRWCIASILSLCVSAAYAVGPLAAKQRPDDVPTYTPESAGMLNGSAFTAWISAQVSSGSKTLALAEGAYHVIPGSDQAHILLSELEDVTIWMDSVNLTMVKVSLTAFNIYRCSNLVTYGPTVWWDTPGFSQATITDVQKNSGNDFQITYHLDDGYDPSFLVNQTTGKLNAEYTNPTTGRLEAGPGWSTINGAPTSLDGKEKTFRVPLQGSYFTPQVGYKLLARGEFIFCNQVTESNNTIINDFTLFNCAGFGFFSGSNRKTTFSSFSLKPAPFPPQNGTELPARSSSADGIHSSGDYIGPTFDSCFFSALDDDCMAVHGSLYSTQDAGPEANSFYAPKGDAAVGDVLRFYSKDTYEVLGTATVTNSSTESTPFIITVNHLPQAVQTVIDDAYWSNQMRVGSGFNILNTHTAGNRGRGAIVKASNGLIANNVFGGVTYAAINLGPEFSGWREADYVHNITLRNNTIDTCNYISKAAAAFMLHGDGSNPINGNSNITIENLTIRNTTASNLYIGASENLSLSDITITDAFKKNYTLWETWPGSIATIENASFTSVTGRNCLQGGMGREGVNLTHLMGSVGGIKNGFLGVC